LFLSALVAVFANNPSSAAPGAASRLVGTWRLVAATQRMVNGAERPDPNVGAKARGYIIYTSTGQMCAMLANSERPHWSLTDRPTEAEALPNVPFSTHSGHSAALLLLGEECKRSTGTAFTQFAAPR
jgi:hypothetical protein